MANEMNLTPEEAVEIFLVRLRKHLLAGDEVTIDEYVVAYDYDHDHFGEPRTVPTGEVRYAITVKPKKKE